MSGCGGAAKSREARVRILVDGETPELYVLQLCAAPPGPPGGAGLCPARKALKALLKETEKELKKRGPAARRGRRERGRSRPTRARGAARDEEPERQCPICLGEMRGPRTLERCRHSFCGECIARALQVRSACPVCGRFYGQLVGNQPPDGRMLVEHPKPGVRYPGTTRVAYLPDCPEGNKVLGLFRKAFAQRLTFTVGTSLTTGRANVITWNDIHHKTNCTGGPQLFGYPDPTYLARVQEELRAKGITED
ncbi:hypothetical protein DUI87_35486 [Hirundo rustica rustica]|uniref:E3 ubiquitin-protein ligase n=1 Tax=Hirundo rustica rustica TaxID=333673 RepID=A0A3M0IJ54_HIRRU|nr:hypothetical protein DUI87_35486 [Hirundo rustica rustica]